MKRRHSLLRTMFGLGAAALFAAANAQVGTPPWWYDNSPDNSRYCFQFNTPGDPFFPDDIWNPYNPPGPPDTQVIGDVFQVPDPENPSDLILCVPPDGYGEVWFTFANLARADWVKHVWLQVDFYEVPGDSDVSLQIVTAGDVINVNEVDDPIPSRPGWTKGTVTFDIVPQPDSETICFQMFGGTAGAYIENFYFGTQCTPVPEPATIAALGLGALGLLARRRRS